METAEVLKKIKAICSNYDRCSVCPFAANSLFCDIPPSHWNIEEIEESANIIDNFKEEEK